MWWWQDRLAGLVQESRRCTSETSLARERWQVATNEAATAGVLARLAAGRHMAMAIGLLRLDDRRREQSVAAAAIEGRLSIAVAALGGQAWHAAHAGPTTLRVRPLLAALAGSAEKLRGRERDLEAVRAERSLELQAAAAVAQRRRAEWMKAQAALAERAVEWRQVALDRQEVDRRRAAVEGRVQTLAADLAAVTALAMPPPSPAEERPGGSQARHGSGAAARPRLLRLAEAAVKWRGAAHYRRLAIASRTQDRFWLQSPSGVRILAPIAGPLQCTRQPMAGPPRAGPCIVALVSQIVSAPVAGRVVFAAPFRGFRAAIDHRSGHGISCRDVGSVAA